MKKKAYRALLASHWFLTWSNRDLEDGGNVFLTDAGGLSTDHIALYPRR
jgi:hypothetical protein